MYGYASSQLLPCAGFEFVESLSVFTFDFFINYDKERDIGCTLMVEVGYSKYLQPLHRDLPFLPEKRIINRVSKLLCTLWCVFVSNKIIKTSFKTPLNFKKSTCYYKIVINKRWLGLYIT